MRTSFNVILKNVTELLNEKLPKYLTYHNTAHTIYVLKKAIDIAKKEHRSLPELELIKLAALYHDIGFTKTHIEHEKVGCEIAKKQLKDFGYSISTFATVFRLVPEEVGTDSKTTVVVVDTKLSAKFIVFLRTL